MKKFSLYLLDLVIILTSTLFAFILRENFDLTHQRIAEFATYLLSTLIVTVLLLPLSRASRVLWRFSALPDYLRLSILMASVTIASVALTFAIDRLDGTPRSLPFLQFNFSLMLLIGLRVLYRLHHNRRRLRRAKAAPLKVFPPAVTQTVLVVGLSRLTEVYLKSISELGQNRIRIAGILGNRERHVGRLIETHEILGIPEDIKRVLFELKTSGVAVDEIVITAPAAFLTPEALHALAEIERERLVDIVYLSERLGFERIEQARLNRRQDIAVSSAANAAAFEIRPDQLNIMRRSPYWAIKRTIDLSLSLMLLILAAPIMAAVAAIGLLSIGRPVLFWQQRPGLGGHAFYLYKFRTMKSAYAANGRELSDDERVSSFGNFLRRTRLDELPQLLNIFRGDMSFIGPRPLLPRDQADAHKARLFVRPGLTGWAQVVGGRAISADDKAALDVWYVKNASLWLDLKIVVKTIPIILFGETISRDLIEQAWADLRAGNAIANSFSKIASEKERAAA